MNRLRIVAFVFLWAWLSAIWCFGSTPQQKSAYAVICAPSHGASAVVINTRPGKSQILTVSHAFCHRGGRLRVDQRLVNKRIKFLMPFPSPGKPQRVGQRIVRIDTTRDLALIELDIGPLPYVCPVGEIRANSVLISCGYDRVRTPCTYDRTTITRRTALVTFTSTTPKPGRSGGALLDLTHGTTVGICIGFTGGRRQEGMYVSCEAIREFLYQGTGQSVQPQPSQPIYQPPVQQQRRPFFRQPFGGQVFAPPS